MLAYEPHRVLFFLFLVTYNNMKSVYCIEKFTVARLPQAVGYLTMVWYMAWTETFLFATTSRLVLGSTHLTDWDQIRFSFTIAATTYNWPFICICTGAKKHESIPPLAQCLYGIMFGRGDLCSLLLCFLFGSHLPLSLSVLLLCCRCLYARHQLTSSCETEGRFTQGQ